MKNAKQSIRAKPMPTLLHLRLKRFAAGGGTDGVYMGGLNREDIRDVLGALEYERQRGVFSDSVNQALPRIPKKALAAMNRAGRAARTDSPLLDPEALGLAIGRAVAEVLVRQCEKRKPTGRGGKRHG